MSATPGLTRESLIEEYVRDVFAMENQEGSKPDRAYYLELIFQVARAVDGNKSAAATGLRFGKDKAI